MGCLQIIVFIVLFFVGAGIMSADFGSIFNVIIGTLVIFTGIFTLVGSAIYGNRKRKKEQLIQENERIARASQTHDEIDKFARVVKSGKKLPTIKPSVFLKTDEECYKEENNVVLLENLKAKDNGKLILTNKRLIYNGGMNTKSFKMEDILTVDCYDNHISIGSEKKQKESLFAALNPELWRLMIYYIKTGSLPIGE